MDIDQAKLDALLQRIVGEIGATASAPLVILGDRLGLYKALAGAGPLTAEQLADRTGVRLRYTQEWLNAQAASGFIDYDPAGETFTLSPEAAMALADDDSPACMLGAFDLLRSLYLDLDKVERAFRSGTGLGWHEHHASLFAGTERFFRPGYNANLASSWIPALDGMQQRLEAGGRVADVGCGFGASTIVMAKAWPASRFVGYDSHPPSIEQARRRAQEAGVADRVSFEVRDLFETPLGEADVVTMYLLPQVNLRLRPRLLAELKPGSRVVSHAWDMGDWEPDEVRRAGGAVVYLWRIPDRAAP